MNVYSRYVLFLGLEVLHLLAAMLSSKDFSGFLLLSNPSLLLFLGFSLCFLCIFFVSRPALRMDPYIENTT